MTGSIWDQVLARIETKVNQHIYSTWFKPTSFVADDGHQLRIRVPNALFSNWLNKHYSVVLDEALTEVNRKGCVVSFVTEESAGRAHDASPRLPPRWRPTGAPSRRTSSTSAPPGSLAPRYSFDAFIVGPSNQFAHAACRAVAEAPSRSYNPLFIYGGVGLGKTHLMHAIGHYVLTHLNASQAHLHLVRAVHERDDQRGALRPHSRFPRALPQRRRAARRRHPVHRRQGRHAERVLPHVQRALRRAEADRHQQRLPAARDPVARRAAAIALRMGPDRRHSGARSRDQGRHPQEKGRNGRNPASRQRRASTSPERSSRTSASSRDRSSG